MQLSLGPLFSPCILQTSEESHELVGSVLLIVAIPQGVVTTVRHGLITTLIGVLKQQRSIFAC